MPTIAFLSPGSSNPIIKLQQGEKVSLSLPEVDWLKSSCPTKICPQIIAGDTAKLSLRCFSETEDRDLLGGFADELILSGRDPIMLAMLDDISHGTALRLEVTLLSSNPSRTIWIAFSALYGEH